MPDKNTLEVWLRGPIANIPALLQPAAHTLLQAREEVNKFMKGFPDHLLWEKASGMASPGFHLKHLAGVLDRLLTYARGEQLNTAQLEYLSKEEISTDQRIGETEKLLQQFNIQVDNALLQISHTDEASLTSPRGVGRAQLPSTVIGLLFHAAEHTQRHIGQLMVTVKIVQQ